MWIDTHNHFDADVFSQTRLTDWQKAQSLGVAAQFVMSISPSNFSSVQRLAAEVDNTYFSLGIHPLFIASLDFDSAITELKIAIESNLANPRFIGIGEIGLDGFIKPTDWERQIQFFNAQLKLARDYELPVFMHARKAQDHVLKYCKRFKINTGIAHAFNGSHQQASRYIDQGFKLGFGGAVTFERAKHLRRLAATVPIDSMVLETDSPDMSPAWARHETNYSYHLPRIAEVIADICDISVKELSKQTLENVGVVVPCLQVPLIVI